MFVPCSQYVLFKAVESGGVPNHFPCVTAQCRRDRPDLKSGTSREHRVFAGRERLPGRQPTLAGNGALSGSALEQIPSGPDHVMKPQKGGTRSPPGAHTARRDGSFVHHPSESIGA